MRVLLVFLFLILQNSIYSQDKNIFDLARKGSKNEIIVFFESHKQVNCNEINPHGFTPLIMACYYNNKEAVLSFLERNVELDYISPEGTALMAVAVKGNVELAELLLTNGANPDLTNDEGITALMYAVQFENKKLVELLLYHNANKKLLDKNGISAFEYAIKTKNEDIINLLKF